MRRLTAEHGELPVTPSVQTGGGGWHYLVDFFAEECEFKPDAKVEAGALREAYESWTKRIGEKPIAGKEYGRRLRERGCKSDRTGRVRYWKGIGLKPSVT